MSRLFDGKERTPARPSDNHVRTPGRANAGDENAHALQQRLGAARGVTPIRYAREQRGQWLVEHGRDGDDYLFQLHPLRVASRPWQDIITGFIAVMDSLFPRSVQIHYKRPDGQWEMNFFTIRVAHVCARPGWEAATKKAIDGLSTVGSS